MYDIVLAHLIRQFVFGLLLFVELHDLIYVFLLHLSDGTFNIDTLFVGKSVSLLERL